MAIADYVKTVWVNNTTPAIQASALNNIENKLDEVVDAGIIIESGSNANGSYQRFSDGTIHQWGSFIPVADGLTNQKPLPYPSIVYTYGWGVNDRIAISASQAPSSTSYGRFDVWIESGTTIYYRSEYAQLTYWDLWARWRV